MYFATSGDILNLAIAVAVIGLAFLTGWILVYFLIILRRAVQILHSLEEGVRQATELITTAHKKLESSSAYLSALIVAAKELITFLIKKHAAKTRTKKKTA